MIKLSLNPNMHPSVMCLVPQKVVHLKNISNDTLETVKMLLFILTANDHSNLHPYWNLAMLQSLSLRSLLCHFNPRTSVRLPHSEIFGGRLAAATVAVVVFCSAIIHCFRALQACVLLLSHIPDLDSIIIFWWEGMLPTGAQGSRATTSNTWPIELVTTGNEEARLLGVGGCEGHPSSAKSHQGHLVML